jgi:hypothetical protein
MASSSSVSPSLSFSVWTGTKFFTGARVPLCTRANCSFSSIGRHRQNSLPRRALESIESCCACDAPIESVWSERLLLFPSARRLRSTDCLGQKQFRLLWRDSRDGFSARNFHGCCDSHANTLALIKDCMENTFRRVHSVEMGVAVIRRYTGSTLLLLQGGSEFE